MNINGISDLKKLAIPIAKLNNYLGCKLCNGYFRDAHTITECLHTFCRECLVTEFEKYGHRNKQCPTCNISVGATPKFIFDRTIQAVVDKIFPQFALEDKAYADGIRINNMKRKNDLIHDNNSTEMTENQHIKSNRLFKSKKVLKDDPNVNMNENETDGFENSIIIRVRPYSSTSSSSSSSSTTVGTSHFDIDDSNINVSSTTGSSSLLSSSPPALPELVKPLLKATEKVKVSKVQKFIHKRLPADISATLNASNISIFHTTATSSIILLDPSQTLQHYITHLNIPINQSDPITLLYKRKE